VHILDSTGHGLLAPGQTSTLKAVAKLPDSHRSFSTGDTKAIGAEVGGQGCPDETERWPGERVVPWGPREFETLCAHLAQATLTGLRGGEKGC